MSKEAMKQAIEAMRFALHVGFDESSESQIKKGDKAVQQHTTAIRALEEALAKQEQGEHKESVRLQCVVCKTVYEDGVPPQVAKQEQGEPVLWAAKESMFMWGNSDESGHPYHIICKGKKVKSHQIPLYTTPQQRTWVGLQDWEIKKLVGNDRYTDLLTAVAIAVEKELKVRNT